MPYFPINKFLTATEDIRLQHRYSTIATELSRSTNFTKKEIIRLIQLHYMLTSKQNRLMDRFCLVQFMDIFLAFRNVDVVEKIYLLRCRRNKNYLTAVEFVELLSLLLKGSLADTIKFCFGIYLELVRSSPYIQKDDVLMMARKSSMRMCKLVNMEEYDQNFVEFIMNQVDKDRDNRISLEDYRKAVNEDVARLQFLGQILPTPENIETFMKLFSTRPYTNNLTAVIQYHESERRRSSTIISTTEPLTSISHSSMTTDETLYNKTHPNTNQTKNNISGVNDFTLI